MRKGLSFKAYLAVVAFGVIVIVVGLAVNSLGIASAGLSFMVVPTCILYFILWQETRKQNRG